MTTRFATLRGALVLVLPLIAPASLKAQGTTPVTVTFTDIGGSCGPIGGVLTATWTPGVGGNPPCVPLLPPLPQFSIAGLVSFMLTGWGTPYPLLVVGASNPQLDLSWITPGCILQAFPDALLGMTWNLAFFGGLAIPCDPSLLGASAYVQAAKFGLTPAPWLGLSNALAISLN